MPKTIRYRFALRCMALALVVAALLTNAQSSRAFHDPPPALSMGGDSTLAPGASGRISTVIDCLTAESSAIAYSLSGSQESSCRSSGSVQITWNGEVERARLVFSVGRFGTLPQAAHTILVNGRPAASAPVADGSGQTLAQDGPEYHYLYISPELIVQGENEIQITDDALPGDRWSATRVQLQLLGQFEPTAAVDDGASATDLPTTATAQLITFENPYDHTTQEALIQVPAGYNAGSATPLVLFAHGRSSSMDYGIEYLGAAANAKGWLLAAPQMHGSWDVPAQCYTRPETCSWDDRNLVNNPGYYAHASLESQYDLIGLAVYMNTHYNIDHDRIYIAGGSMGGQIATVTAAKFPHMFAAVYAYKSITSLGQWYNEIGAGDQLTLEKECHIGGIPKTPAQNPFCYERRSSTYLARNYIHLPISMTHSIKDTLVPISHSRNLRDGINSFGPTIPAVLYEDRTALWKCPDPWHCIEPTPSAVLRTLAAFTRNNNPDRIRIAADESKAFYWLYLTLTGDDHWSYADVIRDPNSPTVQVTTNDPMSVRVGLNLGTGYMRDYVTRQPGLGFPEATYLVKGAGHNELVDYYTGYLTTRVNTTGTSTFTVSAIKVNVQADPAVVTGDQPHVSALTIDVRDQSAQANPVPDGSIVRLQTTEGTFANGQRTINLSTTNGRATTTLTVQPTDDLAEITAAVGLAVGTASVDVIRTGISLDLTAATQIAYAGVPFQLEYRLTNGGDSTISSIIVTDDNGSGGNVTVCQIASLQPKQSTTCRRNISLTRTSSIYAQTTGLPPAGGPVSDDASIQITVIAPKIGLTSDPNPKFVYPGQAAELTYRVANSGDTALTQVRIQDNNGSGGNYTVCSGRTLQPGAATTCTRPIQTNAPMGTTITYNATATGQDPLDNPVSVQMQATVIIGGRIYLPYTVRNN